MSFAERFIRTFRGPLGALLGAVRRAERFLGPADDWVEDDRRIVYEAADAVLRPLGRPTVREVVRRDYVVTAEADSDAVERALVADDYQRNLLSTRKFRTHHGTADRPAGKQWAVGSYVFDDRDTAYQHHVYLFERPDGRTDVYGHREYAVRYPYEHVTEKQIRGDPNHRARSALDAAGIDYGTVDELTTDE